MYKRQYLGSVLSLDSGYLRIDTAHNDVLYAFWIGKTFTSAHTSTVERKSDNQRKSKRQRKFDRPSTITKQWINALPPIAQAKLWNKSELDKAVDPPYYKTQSKLMFLEQYQDEIHSTPELYSEYIDSKKQKVSNFTNRDADCIII